MDVTTVREVDCFICRWPSSADGFHLPMAFICGWPSSTDGLYLRVVFIWGLCFIHLDFVCLPIHDPK
jgi:hypothetical protein